MTDQIDITKTQDYIGYLRAEVLRLQEQYNKLKAESKTLDDRRLESIAELERLRTSDQKYIADLWEKVEGLEKKNAN